MVKKQLGEFLDKYNNTKYNLFYRCGYGTQKKFVYVGNHTKGNLFKFRFNEQEYIHLINRNHTTQNVGLYIPQSKDDLKFILRMILKPMNCELTKLKIKSRERLWDGLRKELILKRLVPEIEVEDD